MTTLQKQVALAAVLLALVWWLWREREARAAASSGAAAVLPPATNAGGGASGINLVIKAALPVTPVDVAAGVADGGIDVLKTDIGIMPNDGWIGDFYEQVWYPASQIPLSNLTAQDWVYAQQFLQNGEGEFTRRDELGLAGKMLLQQANSSGAQLFNSIAGGILSMIPIVGKAFTVVTQQQNAALAAGSAWDTALGNGRLGALMTDCLTSPTLQTRHLLANYSDAFAEDRGGTYGDDLDGPDAPLDRRTMLVPEQIEFYGIWNEEPQPTVLLAHGKQFRMRLRLWTRYQGGWVLPWLCWHFNGDGTETYGLKQTVNARARIFRAADAIICLAQPYRREGAPFGYWCQEPDDYVGSPDRAPRFMGSGEHVSDKTVYFYRNPLVGPMLGSVFPPLAEDARYVGTDGITYSFWGEPMNKPGYVNDSAVDPSPAADSARGHRAI